jgi:sigma-B regulation protein RsbU (phosphoserine phosphatase)
MQRALLPASLPEIAGYRLASKWVPASGFGGDYYDVVPLGADQTALCIADVCGKGLPAALLMSNLQATVRACVEHGAAPHEAMARINAALCRQGVHGRFVTLCVAILDGRTGTLRFCNAGHNAPMLVRANGSVVRLDTGGLIAGVFTEASYESGTTVMRDGDRLLLFTDGLVEAGALAGQEYGDARLVDAVVRNRAAGSTELVDHVFESVRQWAGGRLDDDATAVALAAGA